VISSTDSISGDQPGLAFPPTFVQFIPAPTAFGANNQFIKVSHRIRAVRKARRETTRRAFVIRESIRADVEHGLSPMNELAMNLATGRIYNQYFKVLIVGKALIEKMLCEDAAMCNRVGVRLEFESYPNTRSDTAICRC
jgi:hypothetical protein